MIYINNLPLEHTIEEIRKKIEEIILANNGRILNPAVDILIPRTKEVIDGQEVETHKGECFIILDGWSTFALEDKEEEEKEEEKVVEEEEPANPDLW
mmetsp:Transcript_5971/g.5279  ORF Transcript_5971/g.5279 Transcript_5971/m.5279 type:complete len:97 (+) Transcript_5971:5476-5766(+)